MLRFPPRTDEAAPLSLPRSSPRRGRLPLAARLLLTLGSCLALPLAVAACVRGTGLDAPVRNRVQGRLWVFDGDAEIADVAFDCPASERIGSTDGDVDLTFNGCNPTEDPTRVDVVLRPEDCADLAAVPGLDRFEFAVFGRGVSPVLRFAGARSVELGPLTAADVTAFPDSDTNDYRFVIDDQFGEELGGSRSAVVRDVVGTGNARFQ